jgi:thiol-disulfide isomerase/thioredoxin
LKLQGVRERALAAKLDGVSDIGGLPIGSQAPDFNLVESSGHRRVHLSDFRGKRPTLLVLGSYTCPNFRSHSATLSKLYARYRDQVEFVLVYIREAHGAKSWHSTINERERIEQPDPVTFEQKCEHAISCLRNLKIPFVVTVDGLDNATDRAYAGWPSRVYLLNKQGRVAFNSPLDELTFDATALDAALNFVIRK